MWYLYEASFALWVREGKNKPTHRHTDTHTHTHTLAHTNIRTITRTSMLHCHILVAAALEGRLQAGGNHFFRAEGRHSKQNVEAVGLGVCCSCKALLHATIAEQTIDTTQKRCMHLKFDIPLVVSDHDFESRRPKPEVPVLGKTEPKRMQNAKRCRQRKTNPVRPCWSGPLCCLIVFSSCGGQQRTTALTTDSP